MLRALAGLPRARPGISAGVALAAMLWVAAAWFLDDARQDVLAQARAARTNLSRLIASQLEASFRAIDGTLAHLREDWVRDPASVAGEARRMEANLRDELVAQVAVVGRGGDFLFSSPPSPAVNVADRPYFLAQRDATRDELFVSAPVFGRGTGVWALAFTRRLVDRDGRFAGVILVRLPPLALEQYLREVDLGPEGVITIANLDGTIIARTGTVERFSGATIAGSFAIDPRNPPSGDFAGQARVDGVARDFTYRRFANYRFVALVGQPREAVLAAHGRLRYAVIGTALLLSLVLPLAGWLVDERRRRAATARDEHERMMLELHDGSIQALYALGLRVRGAQQRLAATAPEAARQLGEVQETLAQVIGGLRAFLSGEPVHPPAGGELARAIETLVQEDWPDAVRFELALDAEVASRLGKDEARQLVGIAREAVSNIRRHSGATHATLSLRDAGGELRFEASDDGVGLRDRVEGAGLGLRNIALRASKLGGRMVLEQPPSGGTRLVVTFPAPAAAREGHA